MSLKGWGIALLLTPIPLPLPGMSLIWYGWYWFLKKIGKWYIRGLKIFFLMPAAIVLYIITRIIEAVIGDVEWIVSIFTGGLKNMQVPEGESTLISIPGLSQFKIRYVIAFVGALALDFVLFIQPLVSGGIPEFSIQTFTSFFAVGLPFFLLVVFSGLVNKYQGNSMTSSAKELSAAGVGAGAGAAGAAAAAPAETAAAGKEAASQAADLAEKGAGMYEDIEMGEAASTIGGEGAAAAEGAEGIIAAVGGSSVAAVGGPILVGAILAWIMYSVMAIIISIILLGMTWGYVMQIMPLIAGPIMGAVGLGGAYANWFGESTANSLGPQVDTAFEEEQAALGQLGARIECVFKGPQCLRQWQMNNTVRPGSEDVGERYQLRVVEFGLGVERVDTAYKEKDYTLPINFLVENTRNGIKGITAEDVQYKISIMDNDKTYCSTNGADGSWRNINSQGLQEGDTGYEEQNNILPGLGVTPTQSLDELNLANCELLQPSLGVNRVVEMMMRYDYSSQATLYFDAMSREHRRDEGITPSFTKSETARTPVKSYINVQGPASFYETANGDRRAVPFTARFGFDTDAGIEYRIDPESIRIYDSSLTEPTDQCSGLKAIDESENIYTVSDRAKQRMELRQEEGWFSSNTGPAPLRCTMQLSDSDSVSATGEELIMRMDANYTVRLTEEMESFDVWNTQCSRNKCPMVVTEQYEEDADINLSAECAGVDQRDGCSVRVPEEGESEIDWARLNLAEDAEGDTITVAGGSRAQLAEPYSENVFDDSPWPRYITSYVRSNPEEVVGTKDERPREIVNTPRVGMVAYEDQRLENTLRYQQLPGALCEQHVDYAGLSGTEEGLEEYLGQWEERRAGAGGTAPQSYFIMADEVDCTRGIAQTITDLGGCTVSSGASLVDAVASWDLSEFETSKDCGDNRDRVERCSTGGADREKGVLIEVRDNLQCYGGSF